MSRAFRRASEILAMLDKGRVDGQFSAEIKGALAHLRELSETQGEVTGTVTFSLKITVEGADLVIVPTVVSKLPRPPLGRTIAWVNKDDEITLAHPQQDEFTFGVRDAAERKAAE